MGSRPGEGLARVAAWLSMNVVLADIGEGWLINVDREIEATGTRALPVASVVNAIVAIECLAGVFGNFLGLKLGQLFFLCCITSIAVMAFLSAFRAVPGPTPGYVPSSIFFSLPEILYLRRQSFPTDGWTIRNRSRLSPSL